MSYTNVEPFQKFLFMLLYASGSTGAMKEPITGNLWLHKMMFLLSKMFGDFEDEFEPYHLGPFSERLEAYLDQFMNSDFIRKPSKIVLTEKGEQIASEIWASASEEERIRVIEVKKFFNDLKDEELLAYIYSSYPAMTEKSKVKDNVDRKRKELAVSLFKMKKLSIEKAASVAGISLQDFVALLKHHHIPAYSITREDLKEEQ